MITIYNNKIEVKIFDDESGEWIFEQLSRSDFPKFYNEEVIFSEDLTIGGFMEALYPFYDIIDEHFIAYTRGFKLIEYYTWMHEEVTNEKMDNNISLIEMYWNSEVFDYTDDVTSTFHTSIDYYGSYHGISVDDGCNYSMSLSGINEYKNTIFRLNENFTIVYCGVDENGEYFRRNLVTTKKIWNLYSIIRSFFSELTFYGYKNNVEEIVDNLNESVGSLDKGEINTVSFNSLLLEIEEKNLSEAIKIENYIGAEKIQNKINKLKERISKEN